MLTSSQQLMRLLLLLRWSCPSIDLLGCLRVFFLLGDVKLLVSVFISRAGFGSLSVAVDVKELSPHGYPPTLRLVRSQQGILISAHRTCTLVLLHLLVLLRASGWLVVVGSGASAHPTHGSPRLLSLFRLLDAERVADGG